MNTAQFIQWAQVNVIGTQVKETWQLDGNVHFQLDDSDTVWQIKLLDGTVVATVDSINGVTTSVDSHTEFTSQVSD